MGDLSGSFPVSVRVKTKHAKHVEGDLPENFPVNVQVKTKHAEKTRVGL